MPIDATEYKALMRARRAQRQTDRIAEAIVEDVMHRAGRRMLTCGEEFEVVRRLRRSVPGVTREQREAALQKVII